MEPLTLPAVAVRSMSTAAEEPAATSKLASPSLWEGLEKQPLS